MASPPARSFGLDIVRSTAITLVLLAHVLLLAYRGAAAWAVLSGYLGVEIFFVLSGFLIGGILLRDFSASTTLDTLRRFWIRRWFRTLPNYALFLVINAGLFAWLHRLPADLWKYLFFLQSFAVPVPAFFQESWSLAIEEWFYLLSPLGILAFARLARLNVRRAALLFILVMLAGMPIWRAAYVVIHNPAWLSSVRPMTILRLDACMYGVLGAYVKTYHPRVWLRSPAGCLAVGAGLLATAAFLFLTLSLDSSFHARTTLFCLTSAGALLMLPWLDGLPASTHGWATAITRLSLWSYSLYLVNFPLFLIAYRFLGPKLQVNSGIAPAVATGVVALSIGLAALNYRFFEKPMMDLRERWSRPRAGQPISG